MALQHMLRLAILTCLASAVYPDWIPKAAAAAQLSPECLKAEANAKIMRVRAVETGAPAPDKPRVDATRSADFFEAVSLGDMIAVTVSNLPGLMSSCSGVPIVLFLNGYPLRSVRPYPPGPAEADNSSGDLLFLLVIRQGHKATDGSVINTGSTAGNEDWRPILNRPPWPWERPRTVRVEVGLEDQNPLKLADSIQPPTLYLNIIATRWLLIWGFAFIVTVVGFHWAVFNTNIIRNGNPTVVTGLKGTYSLAKFQGAWWFFIILAAYLFIGIVTGDYQSSINATALILLGIGAGTVIGSSIIDKTRATDDPAKTRTDIEATKLEMTQLEQSLVEIDTRMTASPPPPDAPALNQRRREENARRLQLQSNYYKLTGQSEGFLTDILSDGNGVSFHRFQLAVWTLILGFIFINGVYESLIMPEFNSTLMGLLGLSAGTYLGLKIPEATTPKN